jgi:hypothetical protein
VPSRANELLAMSKLRLRAAVELLTGHTGVRAHLYKLGHTERYECRLYGYDRGQCTHCHCPVLACTRYGIWGNMFLEPKDLETVKVSSLLSLLTNTGLGLTSYNSKEIQWNNTDLGIASECHGIPRLNLILLTCR